MKKHQDLARSSQVLQHHCLPPGCMLRTVRVYNFFSGRTTTRFTTTSTCQQICRGASSERRKSRCPCHIHGPWMEEKEPFRPRTAGVPPLGLAETAMASGHRFQGPACSKARLTQTCGTGTGVSNTGVADGDGEMDWAALAARLDCKAM